MNSTQAGTRKRLLGLCLGFAGLIPASAALAITDPYVGATVTGNANEYGLICGTCPIDFTRFPTEVDGGPGASLAVLSNGGAGYSYSGFATFSGTDGLPLLGARAYADTRVDATIPETFFYESHAVAEALQKYEYTGTTSQTYNISYEITGEFFTGATDAASLMEVYGGLSIYGEGYLPHAEIQPILDYDFTQAKPVAGGATPFDLTGTVSFDLNPGDAFYVWGYLSATADSSHSIMGLTDASHTLTMSFTAGDTMLLTSQIAAVPEAETWAMMLAGLALVGVTVGRRYIA